MTGFPLAARHSWLVRVALGPPPPLRVQCPPRDWPVAGQLLPELSRREGLTPASCLTRVPGPGGGAGAPRCLRVPRTPRAWRGRGRGRGRVPGAFAFCSFPANRPFASSSATRGLMCFAHFYRFVFFLFVRILLFCLLEAAC